MLGLPKSTEMSKQLPKKAVYAKFQMNTTAKEKIDADISRITIVNEITPAKINIPAGEEVRSFFVLLVALKKKDFDEKTVATLSKLIPQNILFVLEFEGQSKLAIYHRVSKEDRHSGCGCTVFVFDVQPYFRRKRSARLFPDLACLRSAFWHWEDVHADSDWFWHFRDSRCCRT